MALFNTDWTNELEQVNQSLSKLLDEKVEPMVDKALDRSVEEIEQALNKASSELQETIKLLSAEADRQRVLLVRDLKKLLGLSFIGIAALISLFGVLRHFIVF